MADNLNFVSSNVNGLDSPEKCIKKFEYLKSKIHNEGTIFLQETHFYDCTDTKSLESTSDTHLQESCHSMFKTTACHIWLYRYPTGISCYYKSFETYI